MKNKFYLLSLTALLTFSSIAQNTSDFSENIKWKTLDKSKKAPDPTIIGASEADFFLINTVKRKEYLEKYNVNTLTLKDSKILDLRYKDKKLELQNTFLANGTPILLTSFYNKKTKKNYLFYHTVNPDNLAISKPNLIGEKTFDKKGMWSRYYANLLVGITLTSTKSESINFLSYPDSKKSIEDKQDRAYIGKIFDENFKEISSCTYNIPFENYSIRERQLGENGAIYILVDKLKENPQSAKKLFKGSRYIYESTHVLVVDTENGELEQFPIKLETEKISKITLTPLKNGGLSVTGLTSGTRGVKGSFSILFDAEMEEVNNTTHIFEDDFITSTWSEKAKAKIDKKNKKKNKKGKKPITPKFYNYYIDHVIELSDGSVTMLAEQYYVRVVTRTSTVNGQTTTTTTYYYYYNDIIAINYDKDGELAWEKVIKKKQYSVNDGGYFLSYFIVEDDDYIHLIYNEGMTAVKVTLDPEGETTKENIIRFTEEKRMRLVPKNCSEMGDGEVFLYARGRKGSKFGTLNLNE